MIMKLVFSKLESKDWVNKMRVRYKMFSNETFRAECDLTKEKANELFHKLEQNPMCLYGELVCEDETEGFEYMEVIKSFENDYRIAETFKSLGCVG